MSQIKAFLEAEAEMLSQMQAPPHIGGYRSMGDFILKNGMSFKPAPLPPTVKRGVMKECFKNATDLVLRHPKRYTYCEGYALGFIPVMHGWVVDAEGNVIDNTWKEGSEYFGVAITYDYLLKMMLKTEMYGVIDQWQHKWPILSAPPKQWRHPIMDKLRKAA